MGAAQAAQLSARDDALARSLARGVYEAQYSSKLVPFVCEAELVAGSELNRQKVVDRERMMSGLCTCSSFGEHMHSKCQHEIGFF